MKEQSPVGDDTGAAPRSPAEPEVQARSGVRTALLILVGVFLAVGSCLYDRGLHDAFQLPKRATFVTIALAIATIVCGWRARLQRSVLPGGALLLVTFLGVALVSAAWALTPERAVAPIRDLLALVSWWLLGWSLIRRPRDLQWVLVGICLAAVITARLGTLQAAGQDSWERVPELRFVAETLGLGYPEHPRLFERLPPVSDPPQGLAGHVNMVAEVVVLGLFATLGLCVSLVHGWRRRAGAARWVPGLGLAVLVGVLLIDARFLLISGSRAAWLATALGVGMFCWGLFPSLKRARLSRRRLVILLAGASALLVVFFLVAPHVTVRGRAGDREVSLARRVSEALDWSAGTERERTLLWGNSLAMLADRPVLGVGPGNWPVAYPAYAQSFGPHPTDRFSLARQPVRAHNDPLQLAAETGLAGLLVMGAFMVLGVRRLWRCSRGDDMALVRAATCCVVAVLVLSCFAFPFQLSVTGSVAFLFLGAGAGMGRGRGAGVMVPRLVMACAAVAFAVAFVTSAFDINGRVKASRAYWFARHDHRAASLPVADRSAVPLSSRQLLQRALDRLDGAVAREPTNYTYHLERARCLWDLGLGDDALSALERVLELHPNLVQAMLLKAELHQRLGRQEDLSQAYDLLFERAASIMPDAPEVRFAQGQHLMLMAERFPEFADRYRSWAIGHFQYAGSPEVREYAPEARLALAGAMLDQGEAVPAVVAVLQLVERDASRDSSLMARCARAYGDPRLGAQVGGLFGPGGVKTEAMWKRVLKMAGGRHPEAKNEVQLGPWYRWRSGNRTDPRPDLEAPARQLRLHLAGDPGAVLPRYHLALVLEDLGKPGEARVEWANLVRYARQGGRLSSFWRKKILFEAAEASRRLDPDRGPDK